jgi:hypothetical protein
VSLIVIPTEPSNLTEPSCASLIVILTKRATRAAGRISDSFARAKPVPVLKSRSGPFLISLREPPTSQMNYSA